MNWRSCSCAHRLVELEHGSQRQWSCARVLPHNQAFKSTFIITVGSKSINCEIMHIMDDTVWMTHWYQIGQPRVHCWTRGTPLKKQTEIQERFVGLNILGKSSPLQVRLFAPWWDPASDNGVTTHTGGGVAHRHDLRYTSDCNEHDDPPDKYHVHLQNTRLRVEYWHCLHLWDFSLRVCVTPQSTRAVCGVSGSTQDDPRRLIEPTGKRAADEIITSAIWPLPPAVCTPLFTREEHIYVGLFGTRFFVFPTVSCEKKRCKDQRNAQNWVKSSRLTWMQTFSPPSSSSPTTRTHFESKLINNCCGRWLLSINLFCCRARTRTSPTTTSPTGKIVNPSPHSCEIQMQLQFKTNPL